MLWAKGGLDQSIGRPPSRTKRLNFQAILLIPGRFPWNRIDCSRPGIWEWLILHKPPCGKAAYESLTLSLQDRNLMLGRPPKELLTCRPSCNEISLRIEAMRHELLMASIPTTVWTQPFNRLSCHQTVDHMLLFHQSSTPQEDWNSIW